MEESLDLFYEIIKTNEVGRWGVFGFFFLPNIAKDFLTIELFKK